MTPAVPAPATAPALPDLQAAQAQARALGELLQAEFEADRKSVV